MVYVLDASAALAVLFGDHADVDTLSGLLEQDDAIAPAVFMPEILHVLIKAERRLRGTSTLLERHLQDIRDMAVVIDADTASFLESHSLKLARTHRLSIFDATYLELAMRLSLPLATFDHGLIRAAKAERVPLLP